MSALPIECSIQIDFHPHFGTPKTMIKRTHSCGDLRDSDAGASVRLCGWVNTYREQGKGLVFLDLRDRAGLTQVVCDLEDSDSELVEIARGLRREDCIGVEGKVRLRDGGANDKLRPAPLSWWPNASRCSASPRPPFCPTTTRQTKSPKISVWNTATSICDAPACRRSYEPVRKSHALFANTSATKVSKWKPRSRSNPVPKGARDFIVPSRQYPGQWYALPQSPQIFKQILMISGCDRYLQIVRCFRDEDPRADRQAEFTQVDLEMSFVDREDVMDIMGSFATRLWQEILGVDIGDIPRMSWHDAMEDYGIDRPDLRFDLKLVDCGDWAGDIGFRVFDDALAKPNPRVKAIVIPRARRKSPASKLTNSTPWPSNLALAACRSPRSRLMGLPPELRSSWPPMLIACEKPLGTRRGLDPVWRGHL